MTLVRFDVDGEIGTITLNRPDKLNALSNDLSRELVDRVKEAAGDDRVRAVVITGAGRAFCAGGDLEGLRRLAETKDWASARDLVGRGGDIAMILQAMPKPSIAAVNGAAAGGGAGLALACDLRIASATASFGLVFNRLGLVPDWSSTYFLPRIVGAGKALEIIFNGEMIDADEAVRLGIFNRVVPPDQLASIVRETAVRLAAKPPLAIRLARQAVHASFNLSLQAVANLEIENQLRCFDSEDAKEGISAFLEKRRPTFRGR